MTSFLMPVRICASSTNAFYTSVPIRKAALNAGPVIEKSTRASKSEAKIEPCLCKIKRWADTWVLQDVDSEWRDSARITLHVCKKENSNS